MQRATGMGLCLSGWQLLQLRSLLHVHLGVQSTGGGSSVLMLVLPGMQLQHCSKHMLPCSTAGAVDRASWLAQPAGLCQAAYGSVTFLQKVWVCKSHPAPAVRALVCLVGFHMTCRCASLVQPIFIVNI